MTRSVTQSGRSQQIGGTNIFESCMVHGMVIIALTKGHQWLQC